MTQGPGTRLPGEMLAAARLAAEMSVAQVSEITKVPPASLKAIEQDEYHKISGDLYVKSFLRLYADAVGLDPEDILDAYRRFIGEVSVTVDGDEVPAWSEAEVEVRSIGLPWHRILPVVAVVIVAGLAVMFFRGCGGEEPAGPLADAIEPAAQAGAAAPDSQAVPLVSPADNPAVETPSAAEQTPPATPPAANASSRLDRSPSSTAGLSPAPAGSPDLDFADGRNYPVVLRVLCERPQDLRVQVDGRGAHLPAFWPSAGTAAAPLEGNRPEPGRVYTVREGFAVYWGGEDHFSLVLERLAEVSVSTNGNDRDLAGVRPGQEWILDVHPPGFFVKP